MSEQHNVEILCCCFMIFTGIFENMEEAVKLYETIKYPQGDNQLLHPCKLRFLYYFQAIKNQIIRSPSSKCLKKITLENFPSSGGLG